MPICIQWTASGSGFSVASSALPFGGTFILATLTHDFLVKFVAPLLPVVFLRTLVFVRSVGFRTKANIDDAGNKTAKPDERPTDCDNPSSSY